MTKDTAPDSSGSPTAPSSDPDVSAAYDTRETSGAKTAPWFRITIIVLFGLVYAWDLFDAISNLLGVTDQISRGNKDRVLIGLTTTAIPWTFLIANVLLPVIVFGFSLLVARKRNVGILAIVLLAGLAVVATGSLTLASLVRALT